MEKLLEKRTVLFKNSLLLTHCFILPVYDALLANGIDIHSLQYNRSAVTVQVFVCIAHQPVGTPPLNVISLLKNIVNECVETPSLKFSLWA